MKLHAIGGLPRSGTTLLCNVLNQNPRFSASSTSLIPQTVSSAAQYMSAQDTMVSALAHDRQDTEKRFHESLRGFVDGWYRATEEPVVFDKSRAWNTNALLLQQLYPDAKLIVMVRHLVDVFASVEKQARNNAMALAPEDVLAKASTMFDRGKGMIGVPVSGIEDILRRKLSNVLVVKYEAFAANPEVVLKNLYNDLGEEWFDGHDFDNVENVATDLDPLWLNRFPHDGSGKIAPSATSWSDWVPQEVAAGIMQGFQGYSGAFGYA